MELNSVSLVYIFKLFLKRILDFFKHWYIDGFLKAVIWTYGILESLDKKLALRITFKNWFQPLYQDYSFIGYLWGFIFRTARIILSLLIYGFLIIVAVLLFLFWISAPIFVIYKIIS